MNLFIDAKLTSDMTEYEVLHNIYNYKKQLQNKADHAPTINDRKILQSTLAATEEILEMLEQNDYDAEHMLLLVKVFSLAKTEELWTAEMKEKVLQAFNGNTKASSYIENSLLKEKNARTIEEEWKIVVREARTISGNESGDNDQPTNYSFDLGSQSEGEVYNAEDMYDGSNAQDTQERTSKTESSGNWAKDTFYRAKNYVDPTGSVFNAKEAKRLFTKKRVVALIAVALLLFGVSELGVYLKKRGESVGQTESNYLSEEQPDNYFFSDSSDYNDYNDTDLEADETTDDSQETDIAQEEKVYIDLSATRGPNILPLGELLISNSNSFEYTSETTKDSFGNKYTAENLGILTSAREDYDTGYVDYYVAGQYKTLTGLVAVSDDSAASNVGTFWIYQRASSEDDWEVVYQKSSDWYETEPFAVEADITGAQWIRIEFEVTEAEWYYNTMTLLLQDFRLFSGEGTAVALPKQEYPDNVTLKQFRAVQSHNLEFVGETKKDTLGNKYTAENLGILTSAREDYDTGYVDYYVAGQYKTLTGLVAVSDDSAASNVGTFWIYQRASSEDDWEVVYQKSSDWYETEPFAVEADITGAQWIRIEFEVTEAEWYYNTTTLLLNDFQLTS